MSVEELVEGVAWFIREFYGWRSIALRALQKPNLNPVDLLGYFGLNRWFSHMYKAAYERDARGRCAANDREIFGRERISYVARRFTRGGPGLLAALLEEVERFSGRRPPADDMTLLTVRRA